MCSWISALGGFEAVKRNLKNTSYFERTELVRSLLNISESSEQGNSACSFYPSQPVRDSHRLTVNKTRATLRWSCHSTECQEWRTWSINMLEGQRIKFCEVKFSVCMYVETKNCDASVWNNSRARLRVPNSENTTFTAFWRSSILLCISTECVFIKCTPPPIKTVLIHCSVQSRCYATTERWEDVPGPFLNNSLVNTFPLLGSTLLIMQQLDYNSGRTVFSMWSVPRCYKQGTKLELSFVRESVKKELEPEAEE
jgi:hypothetical protein